MVFWSENRAGRARVVADGDIEKVFNGKNEKNEKKSEKEIRERAAEAVTIRTGMSLMRHLSKQKKILFQINENNSRIVIVNDKLELNRVWQPYHERERQRVTVAEPH